MKSKKKLLIVLLWEIIVFIYFLIHLFSISIHSNELAQWWRGWTWVWGWNIFFMDTNMDKTDSWWAKGKWWKLMC